MKTKEIVAGTVGEVLTLFQEAIYDGWELDSAQVGFSVFHPGHFAIPIKPSSMPDDIFYNGFEEISDAEIISRLDEETSPTESGVKTFVTNEEGYTAAFGADDFVGESPPENPVKDAFTIK